MFFSHYTGQELEDCVGTKFYCLHALADTTTASGLGRRLGVTYTISMPYY